jgi:hypothetical protein
MPVPVPEYPVPAGPLASRFLVYELLPMRAGLTTIASVEIENAGTAAWRSHSETSKVCLSYHWLDRLGNPLVWDGLRTPLAVDVQPGARVTAWLSVSPPRPPGRYRLAIDLIDEGRLWFAELGNRTLELDVDVLPRIEERTLAVEVGAGPGDLAAATAAALDAQEEPVLDSPEGAAAVAFLAAGAEPATDWSRLVLDAHEEGFAAVAGSITVVGAALRGRGAAGVLRPWAPGFGRSPGWARPLLCPSLTSDAIDGAPWTDPVAGLPALDPSRLPEPWVCDGRIRVSVPLRAVLRAGRPPA